MDSNYKAYDHLASFSRLDTILNQSDLNYEEVDALPACARSRRRGARTSTNLVDDCRGAITSRSSESSILARQPATAPSSCDFTALNPLSRHREGGAFEGDESRDWLGGVVGGVHEVTS